MGLLMETLLDELITWLYDRDLIGSNDAQYHYQAVWTY